MMSGIVAVVCLRPCEKVGPAWPLFCLPNFFGYVRVGRIGSSCCGGGRFDHSTVVKPAVLKTPTSYLEFSTQGGVVPLGGLLAVGVEEFVKIFICLQPQYDVGAGVDQPSAVFLVFSSVVVSTFVVFPIVIFPLAFL